MNSNDRAGKLKKKKQNKKQLHYRPFFTQNYYMASEDLEYSVQVIWSHPQVIQG